MLLSNQIVTKEIKEEILEIPGDKRHSKSSSQENFIARQAYLMKQSLKQSELIPKGTRKRKTKPKVIREKSQRSEQK